MRTKCIYCHTVHEDLHWKNKGGGWYCSKWFKPSQIEFMPQRIKDDRKKHFNSLLQSRRDGIASKEYIEKYGTQDFTKEELKNARYTWRDLSGWSDRAKSL